MRICSIEGCGRKFIAKGLCAGHYQRMRRVGDVWAEMPFSKMPYKRGWNKPAARHRQNIVRRYKRFVGCSVCGYKRNTAALDFHHIDPTKKSFNLGVTYLGGNAPWPKVKEEIRKCIVVCRNCHAELEQPHLTVDNG